MPPGIKSAQAEYCIERFSKHLAAEFRHTAKTPMGDKVVDIVLIPEFLFKEKGTTAGLLVVAKGSGSYVWDGREPIDGFKLVSRGFRPLSLAHSLAGLLNEVIEAASTLTPPDVPAPAQLENGNGSEERSPRAGADATANANSSGQQPRARWKPRRSL